MSGKKLRKESNCLNCNRTVESRFCGFCGQENLEPRESFFDILKHTFEDFSHFDSKFFTTVKYLFLKPGLLTLEFNRGKRASYVNPIRLFFFTSFLFFIGLGILGTTKPKMEKIGGLDIEMTAKDSLVLDSISSDFETGTQTIGKELKLDSSGNKNSVVGNYIIEKYNELNVIYKKDKKSFFSKTIENFFHNLHYLILILLPVFALLYSIFYFRSKHYFVEHLIFAIHFHVITLLLILIGAIFTKLFPTLKTGYLYVLIFFYQFFSMKRVYNQSKRKTLLKLFLIDFIYLIILILFFLFVFVYSLSSIH
jgi:hypothetical protein